MRWDQLFDDLAAQASDSRAAELAGEVAERGRWESGRLGLLERLGGCGGRRLDLRLRDGSRAAGDLADVGAGWLLLADPCGHLLVPAAAVAAVRVPGRGTGPTDAPPSAGLDLRVPLRRLARDRTTVQARLDGGDMVTGTIDRVAADHLELAEHPGDELRRPREVRAVVLLAYVALLTLRLPEVDR